jgi:NADH dehydrogenase
MILVVGATGSLGEKICRRLTSANKKVRALARPTADPKKVERLAATGTEIVYGDLKDPKSLDRACRGVDAVITTATAIISRQEGDTLLSVDQNGTLALVDAALGAGVNHFVYLSFPEMTDEFPLQSAKRKVEAKLQKSKMGFTILRPTYFMESWLGPAVGFDPVNGSAVLIGNGDKAVSWISINDVAEAAVLCLENPKMKNQIVELGGAKALSQREVLSAFEKAGVGSVSLTIVPEDFLREKRNAARKSDSPVDPFQQSIDALMLDMSKGKKIDMTEVMKQIPLSLTSIDTYVQSMISSKLYK